MTKALPKIIWVTAWGELFRYFGETMNQEALDVMDSVLEGVTNNYQDDRIREKREGQASGERKSQT